MSFLAQRLPHGELGTNSRFHLIYGGIFQYWHFRSLFADLELKLTLTMFPTASPPKCCFGSSIGISISVPSC